MPRARTGSAFWHGDHWDIQATLPDGKRTRRVHLAPSFTEEAARAEALRLTTLAAKGKRVLRAAKATTSGETFGTWFARYCDTREAHGLTSVDDMRGHGRKWFKSLNDTLIADITREDVERWVEELDEQVRAGALSWKTGLNTWGTLTKAFSDACGSKVRALRARTDNPTAGVRGPDRGAKVGKVFLYPSEFSRLMACELDAAGGPGVPLTWRRLFAIAAYGYLRAAEIRGLEWADVDLEHRVFNLHRSVDDAGEETTLKGDDARPVPIEPTLLPLLQAMKDEAGDRARVIAKMPPEEDLAEKLRWWLKRAGVDRAALHTTEKAGTATTRRRLRFHDLRASGITWRAVRNDNPMAIMRAAGHKDMATTMEYVRTAEQIGGAFGEVFAPIPASVVSGIFSGNDPVQSLSESLSADLVASKLAKPKGKTAVIPAGIEPALPA